MALPEQICEFGAPGEMRDRLLAAVLSGEKTATSSLLAEWRHERQPLARPGERQTVIDSSGRPVAVIEILASEVIALGQADLALALAEGEGFRSVADWRSAHERFWNDFVRPELADAEIWPLGDHTEIVVEHFRLIERCARP